MKELSVPSKCVVFRNGIEVWIPEGEKLAKFENALDNLQNHMFVAWEGRRMNTADMVGIYLPSDMEDMKRRKNGEWQCKKGVWHERHQDCSCVSSREDDVRWDAIPEVSEEERQRASAALADVKKKFKLKKF